MTNFPPLNIRSFSAPNGNTDRSTTSTQTHITAAIVAGCAVGGLFLIFAFIVVVKCYRNSTAQINQAMVQFNPMNLKNRQSDAAQVNEGDCDRNEISSRSSSPEIDK